MSKQLRAYQQKAIEYTNEFLLEGGGKSGIIHVFTGGGKTFIAHNLVSQLFNLHTQRVIFMAPARSLVTQTAAEFIMDDPGLVHPIKIKIGSDYFMVPQIGTVMAAKDDNDARLIIASVATLIDREAEDYKPITKEDVVVGNNTIKLHPRSERSVLISERVDRILERGGIPDCIIADECHHAVADGTIILMKRLWNLCEVVGRPPTKLIGLTATPYREDSIALSTLFERFIISRSFLWGIRNNYCAPLDDPIRVSAKVGGGGQDFSVLDTENWCEAILAAYEKYAPDEAFICTLKTVEMSKQFRAYMQGSGYRVAHIDGEGIIDKDGVEWPNSHRERIKEEFSKGEYDGLTNFGTLNEGVDFPWVSTLLWARPTDNAVLLTQGVGRIVRLFGGNEYWPKKESAKLIDFTGRSLTILTTGTLLGARRDPFIDLESGLDEYLEEMELDEGTDLRDVLEKGLIAGVENVYTVAKLLRKQSGDIYHHEDSNTMSMNVSPNHSMIILPPQWTLHERVKAKEEEFKNNPEELAKVLTLKELYGNFTLWHVVKESNNRWGIRNNGWVEADGYLDTVVSECVVYAYNHIPEAVDTFVQKRASWKYKPITEKQLNILKLLTKSEVDNTISSGEAARMINHLITLPPVLRHVQELHRKVFSNG